jgi:hypothetical protein
VWWRWGGRTRSRTGRWERPNACCTWNRRQTGMPFPTTAHVLFQPRGRLQLHARAARLVQGQASGRHVRTEGQSVMISPAKRAQRWTSISGARACSRLPPNSADSCLPSCDQTQSKSELPERPGRGLLSAITSWRRGRACALQQIGPHMRSRAHAAERARSGRQSGL